MLHKLICCLIGYVCGSFLTAEIVADRIAGKKAEQIGKTGNPGMANIMGALGFSAGMITLIGDILKCVLAMFLARKFFPDVGRVAMMYAGFGCTLGHDFPFWRPLKGGKGVTTTCSTIIRYGWGWGILACLGAAVVVIFSHYLCLGGPVSPLLFALILFLRKDYEAAVLSLLLGLLSVTRHRKTLAGVFTGETYRVDIIGSIRKKLSKR